MSADGVRYGWTKETQSAVISRLVTRAATYRSLDDFELYGPAREEDMLLALLTLGMLGGGDELEGVARAGDTVVIVLNGEPTRVPAATLLSYATDGKIIVTAGNVSQLKSVLGRDEVTARVKAELAQSRAWTRHYAAAERA